MVTPFEATEVSAHGLGGQRDLPISLDLAVIGAVIALVMSFAVLAVAWRSARYGGELGWPVPGWGQGLVEHPLFGVALRAFGMVVFGYAVVVAFLGENEVVNPFFGIVYAWLWVGIVPMSLLFGPFWKAISPVRTVNSVFARCAGTDADVGLYAYPTRLGYWPAALGLFAFVWLELVSLNSVDLGTVRLWFGIYLAVMLVGGVVFGSGFYERADPFEVYSSLLGRLSVWGWMGGRLLLRSPLANLATTPVAPGLVGVVGVLFGSTGFDSFGDSPQWVRFLQGTQVSGNLLNNAALLVFCAGATGLFALACMLMGTPPVGRRRELPDAFAPTIVPIIFGYVVAHYLNYFLEVGTRTLAYASDPFSSGADYLGTADLPPFVWLAYHPTLLANVKVGAVVVGHVVAAVAAHDAALRLLPRRHGVAGELPLLLAMVGLTAGGLYLLFSS